MKMKRITAILLCALMLAGCGGNTADTEAQSALSSADAVDTDVQTPEDKGEHISFGADVQYECVYETDFESFDPADSILLSGELEIREGMLRTREGKTGGYSTMLFKVGEYADFVYEADFVGHMGGGGLVFLCDGENVKASSDGFCGYMAYVGREGGVGALGVATNNGKWSGNFMVSPEDVTAPGKDIHLRVRVSGNYIIYTLTDIDTGDEIYRCEYIKGDNTK